MANVAAVRRDQAKGRRVVAFAWVLLGPLLGARADLLLNAGDSYTHAFSTIPLALCVSPPQWMTPNAHLYAVFATNGFDASTTSVRVEAFETSTNEAPFFSSLDRIPNPQGLIVGSWWQDLQGVLRVTVVTGTAVLQGVQFGAVTSQPGGVYCAYNTPVIPVGASPQLRIERSAQGVTVAWPGAFSGWVLEASASVGTTNGWRAVTNAPTVSGNELSVTEPISGQSRYYRLRQP